MKNKCDTPSCDRTASVCGLCAPCYSGHYYWKHKPVSATMKRKRQLRILDERLDAIKQFLITPGA